MAATSASANPASEVPTAVEVSQYFAHSSRELICNCFVQCLGSAGNADALANAASPNAAAVVGGAFAGVGVAAAAGAGLCE